MSDEPEVVDLSTRPDSEQCHCLWCATSRTTERRRASHVIDGNSCCRQHFQTAWVWATAKRANRAPHPGCYPRQTPEGEKTDEPQD